MPLYEYKCNECHETMEFIQKFSDPVKTDCKLCGARQSLTKMISSPTIQFKGNGWYLTDYSDKGKKVQAEAKKETNVPEVSKKEKKVENKAKVS